MSYTWNVTPQSWDEVGTALVRVRNAVNAGGGGGGGTWGSITGTLSAQTDLQTALNAKVSTSALSELVDDRVAALLVAGSNITLTYNDVANTLTIAASGGGGSGNTYFPSGW